MFCVWQREREESCYVRRRRAVSLPRGTGASRWDHQSRWSMRFAPTTPPSWGQAPKKGVRSSIMAMTRERPAERPALRGCLSTEQVPGRPRWRVIPVSRDPRLIQSEMPRFNLKWRLAYCANGWTSHAGQRGSVDDRPCATRAWGRGARRRYTTQERGHKPSRQARTESRVETVEAQRVEDSGGHYEWRAAARSDPGRAHGAGAIAGRGCARHYRTPPSSSGQCREGSLNRSPVPVLVVR